MDPKIAPLLDFPLPQGFAFHPTGKFDESEPKLITNAPAKIAFPGLISNIASYDPSRSLADHAPGIYRLGDAVYEKSETLVTLTLDYRDPRGTALAHGEEMIARVRMAVKETDDAPKIGARIPRMLPTNHLTIQRVEFTAKTMDTERHAGQPRQEYADTENCMVTHNDPATALLLSYVLYHEKVMKDPEFPPALLNFNPKYVWVKAGVVCQRANFPAIGIFHGGDGPIATVMDIGTDDNHFFTFRNGRLCDTGEDRELEPEFKRIGYIGSCGGGDDRSQYTRYLEDQVRGALQQKTTVDFDPNPYSKVERADARALMYHLGTRAKLHTPLLTNDFARTAGNHDRVYEHAISLESLFRDKEKLNQITDFVREVRQYDGRFVNRMASSIGARVCQYG